MNKGVALVGGVGLGAALMYIFDPDRGNRRRALIRDKVVAAGNKANDAAGKLGRDLSNRATGLAAETKSLFQHEEVSDDVLVDRVRSRLGRIPGSISGCDVQATRGVVTLRGQIGGADVAKVLRAVRFVRGVKSVINHLAVNQEAGNGNAPALGSQPQPLGA